jgi:hypothetical protein
MPDKKKFLTICAFCKLPIRASQRPSVRLDREREAHMECYVRDNELKQQQKKDPSS